MSASLSAFNVQAVANAIISDCSTMLFKYASFPGSCHASNAEYVLREIEESRDKHGELGSNVVERWANNIAKQNFCIQGRSMNEEADGPGTFAICENLKTVMGSLAIQQTQ